MSEEIRNERKRNTSRQIIGMAAGGGIGLMLFAIYPVFDMFSMVIYGALLGVIVISLDRLEAAGQIITKRDNRWLNIGVGIIIPMIFILAIALVLR